jgi:hypothetical protein
MYMVGIAAVYWAIWTVRSPMEAVFTMCSFLLYWTGLKSIEWSCWCLELDDLLRCGSMFGCCARRLSVVVSFGCCSVRMVV